MYIILDLKANFYSLHHPLLVDSSMVKSTLKMSQWNLVVLMNKKNVWDPLPCTNFIEVLVPILGSKELIRFILWKSTYIAKI